MIVEGYRQIGQPIQLEELKSFLWGAATRLRGQIDAAGYKEYIFPLLFFKRISDVYAENIEKCEDGKLTIRRLIDGGAETVEAPMPVVVTVNGSAAPCRPCNAKLVMKYKRATAPMERTEDMPYKELYDERPYLTLNQWSVADVDGDPQQCGLSGSPTKVKAVKNIVFQAKESKTLTGSDADVEGLIKELLNEKIIG